MALQGIETSWSQWRRVFGPPGSRQRRDLMPLLDVQPTLLYWGDSWFTTPLYMDLAMQSMQRIDGKAMVVGKPGALAAKLFTDRSIDRMVGRLKAYPFDVLCLSAGGNDGLSERLEEVFGKAWDGEPLSAQAAFQRVVAAGLFKGVAGRYRTLLTALAPLQQERPAFRVVGHGYALPLLIGKAATLTVDNIGLVAIFKNNTGPWLWPPMQPVLGTTGAAREFAQLMMTEGFRDLVLKPMTTAFPGLFSYADFTAVPAAGKPAFWNDEIHPTESGFNALSPLLNDAIRAAVPKKKKAAVK